MEHVFLFKVQFQSASLIFPPGLMTSTIDENGKGEDKKRGDHLKTGKNALEFMNVNASHHGCAPAPHGESSAHCITPWRSPAALEKGPHLTAASEKGLPVSGPTNVQCKHQLANHRGHQLHAK